MQAFPAAPDPAAFAELLDTFAPLTPAPLSPELRVFHARDLVQLWEAAEALAAAPLPSPFWAYPWPGGAALARVLLDAPERVRGRTVLDFGCGGGIAAIAAAAAGAAEVIANDIDPWALAATREAARRQGLSVSTCSADLTAPDARLPRADVVLCGDLGYERSHAGSQLRLLARFASAGATVLVANAGRRYFDAGGRDPIGAWTLPVPHDLEGVAERTVHVYAWA